MSTIEFPIPPIVVMGVSGCGKSTVAAILANVLSRPFVEGDGLHPTRNIRKMSAGHALDDDDRFAWLETIGLHLRMSGGGVSPVVSCSALKRRYRQQLRGVAQRPVIFLHLQVSHAEIVERVSRRKDHFMPLGLVDSQFADLEDPQNEDDVITIPGPGTASELVDRFLHELRARNSCVYRFNAL